MSAIPAGLRIAVYNAMGGWGPYTVPQIVEVFQTYGFTETDTTTEDVGGARRSAVEEFQRCIDWSDRDARRRYLMLVEDVLDHYQPDDAGVVPSEARAVQRALKLKGLRLPSEDSVTAEEAAEDLWRPSEAPRVFLSHLASRKHEVHKLAAMLQAFGFACFVAHDAIEPSRAWQREIERGLASCDVLVAYITKGFRDSSWTDQEVGWALGRGVIAIPVSVDGVDPYGFIGGFQAVKRAKATTDAALSRLIFRAVVDATLARGPQAPKRLATHIPSQVVHAMSKAATPTTAKFFFEVLLKIPPASITPKLVARLSEALDERAVLQECAVDRRSYAKHVRALTRPAS